MENEKRLIRYRFKTRAVADCREYADASQLWLWGHRTKDDEKRSFGGYTQYPNNAEVYSLEDWAKSGYNNCGWMKLDEPVQLCINFCKKYKQYDTVLVSLDQYIKYCECAGLPLDRPKEA